MWFALGVYIGKRRMEKALIMLQRSDIELRWRAFDLNADTPKGGVPWQAHMIRKFGSLAYARQLEAHVAAAATLDAHDLIWLAGREGMPPDLVERLYHAYFVNGEDLERTTR
jgi:predicted DsbA family dithiol-disulfide isomerase